MFDLNSLKISHFVGLLALILNFQKSFAEAAESVHSSFHHLKQMKARDGTQSKFSTNSNNVDFEGIIYSVWHVIVIL